MLMNKKLYWQWNLTQFVFDESGKFRIPVFGKKHYCLFLNCIRDFISSPLCFICAPGSPCYTFQTVYFFFGQRFPYLGCHCLNDNKIISCGLCPYVCNALTHAYIIPRYTISNQVSLIQKRRHHPHGQRRGDSINLSVLACPVAGGIKITLGIIRGRVFIPMSKDNACGLKVCFLA